VCRVWGVGGRGLCVGVGVNLANCRVQGVRCKGYGLVLRYCRAGKHTAKCAHHEGCGRCCAVVHHEGCEALCIMTCCTSRGLREVLHITRGVGSVVWLVFEGCGRCCAVGVCVCAEVSCQMGVLYVYVYVWDGGVCVCICVGWGCMWVMGLHVYAYVCDRRACVCHEASSFF
jgi:hypothetical protein